MKLRVCTRKVLANKNNSNTISGLLFDEIYWLNKYRRYFYTFMQDKYAGDIGDFGKYILLNELWKLSEGSIKLGLNWYYVNKLEKNSSDGRHTSYLNSQNPNNKHFEVCNPKLYFQLKNIIEANKRNIAEIEKGSILPSKTIFFSMPIPFSSNSPSQRSQNRESWFQNSLRQLKAADVVFLDPDNGIQTSNLQKSQARAVKYSFTDEMLNYYQAGESVIVYQHRDRSPKEKYDTKFKMLSDAAGCNIQVLRFKRVSVRNYIFLPQFKHRNLFNKLFTHLTTSPYNFLFEKYQI
jgi:hypothetical protein